MDKTEDICTPGGNPDASPENPRSYSYEVGPADSGEDQTLQTTESMKNLSLTAGKSGVEVGHAVQVCTKRLTKTKDLLEGETVGGSNVEIGLAEPVGTKRSITTDGLPKGKTPDGVPAVMLEMVDQAVQSCTKGSTIAVDDPKGVKSLDSSQLRTKLKRARKRDRQRKRKTLANGSTVGGNGGSSNTNSVESTPEEVASGKRFKGVIQCPKTHGATNEGEIGIRRNEMGVLPVVVGDPSKLREPVGHGGQPVTTVVGRASNSRILVGRGGGHPPRPTKRKAKQAFTSHQAPREDKRRKTFSEITRGDLHMGIICDAGLDESKLAVIRAALLDALDLLPEDAGDIGIMDVKLEEGIITVKCVNQKSKEWLCGIVGKMTDLWEGINLRIDILTSIKNVSKMTLRVAGPTQVNSSVILARLRRQNACVKDTSKWRVTRISKYDDGKGGGHILTVFCPKEAAEEIRSTGGKLNCGLDFVYARVSSGEKLDGKIQPVGQLSDTS